MTCCTPFAEPFTVCISYCAQFVVLAVLDVLAAEVKYLEHHLTVVCAAALCAVLTLLLPDGG